MIVCLEFSNAIYFFSNQIAKKSYKKLVACNCFDEINSERKDKNDSRNLRRNDAAVCEKRL